MERDELNFVIEHNKYLSGGTKEACIKIRDFTKKITYQEGSAFIKEKTVEFIESVKILMAFSFGQKDTLCKNAAKRALVQLNIYEEGKIEGGIYKAMATVSSFIYLLGDNLENLVESPSCISQKEFIDSLKVLVEFSSKQPDQIPKRWYCDNDCYMVSWLLCPGECNIDKKSKNLCNHYVAES